MSDIESLGIAVIGFAGRFPQAPNIDAFWELLKNGQEAVTQFTDEELLAAGVEPTLLEHPDYVKTGIVIADVEYFDADFFEMSRRDAEITDPQQRLFMECAWQSLEHAGYPPSTEVKIGVYAGVSDNSYQHHYLASNMEELLTTVGEFRLSTLSGKDFIATRTAYKLNLTGPAMTVQTACSTSLVAVHVACQSLLNFECDIALAGGATIYFPQGQGYLYQEGMIMSPDGHCRAFDAQAQGTTGGGGVAVVVLKRLDEALADGDTIHAVILGSALNNDGADKIGYTAPSVKGQTEVVLEAQGAAGVHPDEISYIEAHGTGTHLGDPIEIQALTQAFRANTDRTGYCAIGSVKTNIGHADTAAGVAGLIKTVLALKHRQIPPSLHFEKPNPQIDFANSPFFVNNRLRDWEVNGNSRRCAGVSSFGIGGTNAHVIVTEAPSLDRGDDDSDWGQSYHLLCLSTKTKTALEKANQNLEQHLRKQPELNLADVAYTLQVGRQAFAHRQILVCRDISEATDLLREPDPQRVVSQQASETPPNIIFMFPGSGAQYPNMGRGLYESLEKSNPKYTLAYREHINHCLEIVQARFNIDLKPFLFPEPDSSKLEQARLMLEKPSLGLPALFMTEYALAKLWMSLGIEPIAMIGHSLGEYVAACLAGVLSLEDALSIVTWRGQLIETLPPGGMLSVYLPESELQTLLPDELVISVINGPDLCTVSGPVEAIDKLSDRLTKDEVVFQRIKISFAAHSPMLEPILSEFSQRLQQVQFSQPTLPFINNITGSWISPQEAMSPDYWVRHLRHTVRFTDGLSELLSEPNRLFLEIGPGKTLQTLVRTHPNKEDSQAALTSLRHPQDVMSDLQYTLHTLGQLWLNGVEINWQTLYQAEHRQRVPLPTYPFERQRYWIEARQQQSQSVQQFVDSPIIHSLTVPTEQTTSLTITQSEQALSATEQQIAMIWSQSLGITDIGPDTNFFAIGGDSLLATLVTARLGNHFGVKLNTHSLLQAPTIAQLATLITAQTKQSEVESTVSELVVQIQAGNPTRKPLILMHPVGGHVYFYRELARHLDPQLPVYGIRAQGAEGEAEPLTNMTDMAKVYTQALQTLQPQGPYYLGGASFGGTLAYAIAQELIAQGETVPFLGLIDTPSQGNMPDEFEQTAEILFYLLKVGENVDIDLETLSALDETAQLDFFIQHSHLEDNLVTHEELKIMLKLWKTNMRAMYDYVPPAYPGKLQFFLASERDDFTARTPANGWIGLVESIEIYNVPGNHITMNSEPHVQQLAKYIQQAVLYNNHLIKFD